MKSSFLKYLFFPVLFLLVFQGEGRGEVRVTEKIPIKTDIVSNFGAKIQANVDNILAAFPIDETHQFYQKLVGRADEIHEAILDNIGDIGLRSVDDLNQFFADIAAVGEELMEAFATNPNLINAWDALFDLPGLRINTTKLKAVDDFATAKNIDHTLVKTEINSLPSHKEDLIKGFEISNGTASYPTISNKGVIQTDGNLLGKLENGHFVPVGNAQAAGTMDYVVMQNGEILLGSKHTFLSQGDDVLAAGTVKFNVNGNGTLSDISNASGHYLPTPGEGMNFLRLFKSKGVDTQNTFLSIYEEGGTIFKQVHPNANARKLYEL